MSEKVQVPLREVKQLFLFLEELNAFFHQPMNYQDTAALEEYLENGMYKKLHAMYYDVVWNWLPSTIQKEIEDR